MASACRKQPALLHKAVVIPMEYKQVHWPHLGMSKPQPQKYRTTKWRDYNRSLKQRGSILLWIDRGMGCLAPASGKRRRAEKFSDAAIQFLMVKNLRIAELQIRAALSNRFTQLGMPITIAIP